MSGDRQILRMWTGTTRTGDADHYEKYLVETGLRGYTNTPGNLSAYFTRRERGGVTEFCLVTIWQDETALRTFAGDQLERAVFYPEDDRYLVDRDLTVAHFDIFAMTSSPRLRPQRKTTRRDAS